MANLMLLIVLAIQPGPHLTSPEQPVDKKILIYSRVSPDYFVHDNITASVRAVEEICRELNIKTVSSDDPEVFTSHSLAGFDGIVFCNTNAEAFTSDAQRNAFQAFIRSGKGFAGIHSASTSEPDWPWFVSMIGGSFLRHPSLQEFDILVIDSLQISTTHLPQVWKWEDEPYYHHLFNPDIHVLLAADMTTVEDDQKQTYPGTTFGNKIPLAWCHRFEGGRQWFSALGHKIEYYDDPDFRKHIQGGILWILDTR